MPSRRHHVVAACTGVGTECWWFCARVRSFRIFCGLYNCCCCCCCINEPGDKSPSLAACTACPFVRPLSIANGTEHTSTSNLHALAKVPDGSAHICARRALPVQRALHVWMCHAAIRVTASLAGCSASEGTGLAPTGHTQASDADGAQLTASCRGSSR